jgi:hypothetical protein
VERPGDQPRTAELEELGVQQVARQRRSRPGLGPAIGALALVGLLATGFGLLGGRPDATPTWTDAAIAAPSMPTPSLDPMRTPVVTPWSECGPDPVEPPVIKLESNGRPFAGEVELAVDGQSIGPTPTPLPSNMNPFGTIRGPDVSVRPDVITELWIEGGACALEWSIELIDHVSRAGFVLSEAHNPAMDPGYAAQNRFNVSLGMGEHRAIGHDVQFGGVFVFRTMIVRAFWRLRIGELDRPYPQLLPTEQFGRTVATEGCDVTMSLGNGYVEGTNPPCDTDLTFPLEQGVLVEAGDMLNFVFSGWTPSGFVVQCGDTVDVDFAEWHWSDCWSANPVGRPFPAPEFTGERTLAFATCATQDGSNAENRICGTWYMRVEVVEQIPTEGRVIRLSEPSGGFGG